MCFEPPVITQQPASTNVAVGDPAAFAVTATSALPMSYQWQFNTTNLPNATNSSFILQTSSLSDSGGYQVIVSNAGGSVTSLVATLTVTNPFCAPPPAGLVAWWKAEGNANDLVGGNNGTLMNGAGFAPGRVGTAFSFHGTNQAVDVGNPTSLQITGSISIETWFKTTAPVGNFNMLVSKWDCYCGSYNASYSLNWQDGFGLTFVLNNQVNGGAGAFSYANWNDGVWHHAVGTWDGSVVAI